MLKGSIWGIVCALGVVAVSVTACSAKGVDSCDPNDPSCASSSPSTRSPSGNGTANGSGSADGTGSNTGTGTGATPAPTTSTPTNPPPTTTDGGTGTADSLCGAKTTADDCYSCCVDAHPAGDAVQEQAFGDCTCGTPGTCKTQCAASYCSDNGPDPTPGDACDTCLNKADQGACGDKAQAACDGNADCKLIDSCIAAAKCDTKK